MLFRLVNRRCERFPMEIEINGVYYLFRIVVSIIIVANGMEFDRSCVLFILLTLSLLSDLIVSRS